MRLVPDSESGDEGRGSVVSIRSSPLLPSAGAALILAAWLAAPGPCAAATWNVRSDGSGSFTTIQAGVDAAADGDTVDVGPGIYYEHVSIVDKTLLVRGAGRDQTEVNGYPHGHVFALRGYSNYSEIRALTMRDGWADTRADVNGGIYGGGVLGDGAVFALVDCRITHCYAMSLGGAVYATSERIIPDEYRAPGRPRPSRVPVPGVDHDVVLLRNCRFDDNNAGAEGGGFNFEFAYFAVEDCVIEDNWGGDGGGGRIFNAFGSVQGCLFRNNEALLDGGALDTEQNVYSPTTSISITGNTIVENHAGRDGSAAFITRGITIVYERNVFALNYGTAASVVGCRLPEGEYHGSCNHFWNNAAPPLVECLPDGSDTSGDPLFCAPGIGDFRVCEASPLLTGPCGVRAVLGTGCKSPGCATATVPVTWGAVKSLYR